MENFTKAVIEDIREEAVGTRSFFFKIPEGITWEGGADMHFALPDFMDSGEPDKSRIRHMSLMTLPEEGKIGFTTRVPGSGSEYKKRLECLAPGDELVMFKLGNRIPLRREGRLVTFISMGVGFATVRPMILQWLNDSTDIPSVTNLVAAKKNQVLFKDDFASTAEINLTHIISENRDCFYIDFESLQFNDNMIFYIVGSDSFLEDVIKRLKAKNIKPENIEIDKKPDKKALMLG